MVRNDPIDALLLELLVEIAGCVIWYEVILR